MKINDFSGGLNIRQDASLIAINEAILYQNINNTKGVLESCKNLLQTDILVNGYVYFFADTWLSSDNERSYVEYKNALYWTEANLTASWFNGFREIKLGIEPPKVALTTTEVAPVSSGISGSSETMQYTYTFYNSQDGIESVPAPLSEELALAANKDVELTNFDVSEDVQVDKIRIYRIGAGPTDFTLVMEVDNESATLTDSIEALDLPGDILDSYNNYPAPEGLRHLTENGGIFFGIVEDKLYFSTTGKPYYWPAANYLDFSQDLTGLLVITEGLIVFSTYKADLLVGNDSSNFAIQKLSLEQGSVSHLSGKIVKGTPIWVSAEGFCGYFNGVINVISKDKLGLQNLDIINSTVYDEIYYLCLTDGTLLAFDTRFNTIYKTYSFDNLIDNIYTVNGILYVRIKDYLYEVFSNEDDIDLQYTSPKFTEGDYTVSKLYDNIYIRSNGEFTIKVYIDDKLVLQKDLLGNTIHDIKPPQEKQRGSSIQFNIVGKGIIYEIEYKVQGRQNGR